MYAPGIRSRSRPRHVAPEPAHVVAQQNIHMQHHTASSGRGQDIRRDGAHALTR